MAVHYSYQTFLTIAALKASLGSTQNRPRQDQLYYLAEAGKEGLFYFDPTDTTTAENTGLVLVTTTGSHRMKRRLLGSFVFKSWFTGSVFYFSSTTDANTTISSGYRFAGMRIYVQESGIIREYWWRDGTADINLVPVAEELIISNGPTTFDRKELATVPGINEILIKSVSVTGSNGVNVTPTVNSDSVDWVIDGAAFSLFTVGTFAQRPSSPSIGQGFYQTDIREGRYHYDGGNWEYFLGSNTLVFEPMSGNLPVYYASSVNGTGAAGSQDATAGNRWRFDTGTTTTGYARLQLASNFLSVHGTTGKIILHAEKVAVGSLSSGTERYLYRIGKSTGADVSGMWFEYSDNVASGQWNCVNYNGTRTETASGITVVANTEYTLCIVYDFTGTDNIKFYINNALVATHTTNLPANFTGTFFGSVSMEKSAGTTNRASFIGPITIQRIL